MDPNKRVFNEYLENKGCIDALWKVLIEVEDQRKIGLDNPMAYMRSNIDRDLTETFDHLRNQANDEKQELSQLAEEYPKPYAKYMKAKSKKLKKAKPKKGKGEN